MSPVKKPPAKRVRPKPRIPLPTKPGKVMDDDTTYKRRPKHRKGKEEGG